MENLPPLAPRPYRIGISPPHLTVPPDPLFNSAAPWKEVAREANMYKCHGVQLGGHKWPTKITAPKMAAFMTSHSMALGCEFGNYHYWNQNDPDSSAIAFDQLDPVFQAGGTVSTFHLAGPIHRMIHGTSQRPPGLSLDQVTSNILSLQKAVRAKYSKIKIGIIINLYKWDYRPGLPGYDGEYTDKSGVYAAQALEKIHQVLTQAGERIDFIEFECPYNYYQARMTGKGDSAINNSQTFRELEKWCRDRNIRVHVIINGDPSEEGAQGFHERTCEFVRHLRRDGIFPDLFLIQSWYQQPAAHLPETQADTFMYTAREAIRLIRSLYPSKGN